MPRWKEIEHHADQVGKLRARLGCGNTPWQLIKRPKGMETRDFERMKGRLAYHEKAAKHKINLYIGWGKYHGIKNR